jgi:hypothetical protein
MENAKNHVGPSLTMAQHIKKVNRLGRFHIISNTLNAIFIQNVIFAFFAFW